MSAAVDETTVRPGIVLEHLAQVVRLRRPAIPAWTATTDLTVGQVRLLFHLGRRGPTAMSQVAEWLGVDRATATGIVDRIERRGLVRRERRDDDRRVVECRLSDAGAALVAEIDGIRLDAMQQLLGLLEAPELEAFDRLLAKIIDRSTEQPS